MLEYKIVEKHDCENGFILLKGLRASDNKPVLLKIYHDTFLSEEQTKKLVHEFEIGRRISDNQVLGYLDLVPWEQGQALVLEDFRAYNIRRFFAENKHSLLDILSVAVRLASCLAKIHDYGIVHGDIRPESILIDSKTLEIKLFNFHLASHLYITHEEFPQQVGGDFDFRLAYSSPEETRRMNRSIDFRSDLYSLGVCLYEWCTGKTPFESDDQMELVHSHLAKEPVKPEIVNPKIPIALAQIIMKLLAKAPGVLTT